MCRISLCFFVLVSLSIIMNFVCLLKLWFFSRKCLHNDEQCSSQNHISIIWFWVEDVLNNFCGYLAVYWKQSLPFLPIIFYTTYTPLNIWHTHYNNKLRENVCWLLKFDVVMTWLQHRFILFAKHLSVSKCFCLFSLQCCFRFFYCRWVPWCFCFVWKL